MSNLAAAKLASDLIVAGMEAIITAQKINAMMHDLQGREMTPEDWARIDADSKDANDKLHAARVAAGFV